ncbi:DnaD domain-containing protein [Paenibacillus sp. TAB 01]|uniref:DnaD domain-containing protein n=1 Tax=Paenibacillus sp. TAB 01 TaxID=3368988 RepID=UPI0037505C8E
MDYTKEITAFYDWLETNTLTDSAIVLWHALMHTCNRAGWPDEFTVAVSTLSNKTGLKKDAINRARHRLQQTGRIDFQSRTGQQSAIYKIIPFCDGLSDANHATNCVTSRAQTASQTASIIISSSSSSSSYEKGAYESYYAAHERVFGVACNPFQSQTLGAYIDQDGMEEAVVIHAIERAALASTGYNFKFITRILDDYFKSGVRTLGQAKANDAAYDARKNKPQGSSQREDKASYFAEQARREREREHE